MKKKLKYILDIVFKDISVFGGLVFYLFISILYFIIFKNIILFITQLLGLFLSYIIVILIRVLYYKKRPDNQKYSNLVEKIDSSSFPSMHSIRICMIFIFTYYYLNNFFLSLLFLSLIFLVSFSRIYLKRHFLIDILVGYIIGIFLSIVLISIF